VIDHDWQPVKLGDIFVIASGGTPSKKHLEYYENGTVHWVKTGDLKNKFIYNTPDLITEEGLKNSSAKKFPIGTTLIAMYGATIGACSILAIEAATNQACAAFLPNAKVQPAYFYAFLCSQKNKFVNMGVGGAQPNISATILKKVKMPLPPIETQKQIAAILDKASQLIELRKQQLAKMDLLIKSKFIAMFGDPVINSMGWDGIELAAVANIVSGITKGRKTREQEMIVVPYMRVANVKDGHIDLSEIKMISATISEIEQYALEADDVLMTEGGDPDKLGRGAIWHYEFKDCIHQNHVFRVRLNKEKVNPQYFAEYLKHPKAKQYFLRCAKQTTGIASINMKQLKALPILEPPIELQNKFAAFVDTVEQQKAVMQASLEKLEINYKSLMQQYFG